jgi:hypothetical protein
MGLSSGEALPFGGRWRALAGLRALLVFHLSVVGPGGVGAHGVLLKLVGFAGLLSGGLGFLAWR